MKKRILFVDDERAVLDGLRRSLRRYRDRYETCFADSGEAALAQLQAGSFDIVVSDMRMPGMDGFALLTQVRERFPDTLRLILSGQTEQEVAMRSIAVSHQFLAKPCEGEQLRRVLDRACTVRDLCTDDHQRGVISRLGGLPSAPKLYTELTAAMGDEEVSAAEIAAIVEKDMAMSSKLMQIVNSAYLGLPREISKVQDAVSFLGSATIRTLALAEGAFSALKPSAFFDAGDLRKEQERGMLTARVARSICEDEVMGEQAFLAGMLHDLGVLILATEFPKEFEVFRSLEVDEPGDQSLEVTAFGTTHAKLGAFLLGSWGLPIRVTEAVAFHHEPMAVEHDQFDVVTAVHVASALVGELLPTHVLKSTDTELDRDYLKHLGLGDQLRGWCEKAHSIIIKEEDQPNAA